MTKTYQITFNPKQVSSKPKKNSLEMSNHLNGINVPTGITINEFANMVSNPNSHTWFGGTYNTSITNHNWTSTQVIGLDFDSGDYTVEETIDKLKLNGIHPQLWYSSFSSTTSNPKFRVVLFIDQPITNPEHRELIYKGLLQLVPHADVSCKNAARIFFGGKEAVILHNEPISVQSLIDSAAIAVITADKGRSRYIPEELVSTYNGENSEFLFNTNRNYPFLPNIPPNPITIMGKALPSINWIKAKERVRILKDFLDGKWLSHMQLFGLATNFIHVKGGQKLMNETMIKYNQEGKTDYSENNFNIITYVKKVAYRAVPIYKFTEHDEDADLHDLYSAVIDIRGKIELIKPIVLTPLALAEKTFKQRFQEVLKKGNDEKVYLFRVPTAIGKTELITQVNATLAFPTHSLKNEVKNRMKVKNVLSPDSIIFKDEKLNIRLQYLYGAGMLQKATAMIYDIASGENSFEYYQDDIITAAQYLKQLEESQVTKNTVLTTHTRALHINHSHSTIIFDEDPLETVLPIQIAQISDLVKVQLVGDKLFKPLLKYIQQLSSSEPGICHRTPTFEGDPEELVDLIAKVKPDSNLIDLLNSKYFIKNKRDQNTLHYILNNPLPPNKKIIILSATAPIPIYQELFKDRLEVIELTDVEQKGNIIQTTKQSCSRNSLTRYADSIAKKVGDTPVITFKSFKQYFKNPIEEMYFGNCSGYDNLKGQDISVVGTPHRNNVVYHLYAAILGGRTAINVDMVYQKVEYNGFKFKFNCYEDELLKNIQLSLIESDLIQAVGRARTLRTNATVQLYSNFPLRISSTFIF